MASLGFLLQYAFYAIKYTIWDNLSPYRKELNISCIIYDSLNRLIIYYCSHFNIFRNQRDISSIQIMHGQTFNKKCQIAIFFEQRLVKSLRGKLLPLNNAVVFATINGLSDDRIHQFKRNLPLYLKISDGKRGSGTGKGAGWPRWVRIFRGKSQNNLKSF